MEHLRNVYGTGGVLSSARGKREKIPQQLVSVGAGDAFGMELDAVDRKAPVGEGLDGAVGGLGGDREAAGQAGARDRERVVARRREGRGEAGEDAAPVVRNGAGLAMHRRRRALDPAAEGFGDRLVAEADAEQRPPRRRAGRDERERDAGLARRAGARSEEHTSELRHVKISYAVFCLKKKT